MQEMNFKLLTRFYLTPSRLHKCFPSSSDHFWHCREEDGSLLHIFWSCPRLQSFWGDICRIIQEFTEYVIPEDAAFFLLHHSKISAKAYKKSLVRHLLNVAKACIPLFWKQQSPPTSAHWLRKVEEVKKMEDLILTAQHRRETFTKTWDMWNIFIFSDEGQRLLGS